MQINPKLLYALNNLFRMMAVEEMPMKATIKWRQNRKRVQEDLELLEEARMDLNKEYGLKDEDGELQTTKEGARETIVVDPDRKEEYDEKMADLFDQDIEVDIRPIPASDFGDFKISDDRLDVLIECGLILEDF